MLRNAWRALARSTAAWQTHRNAFRASCASVPWGGFSDGAAPSPALTEPARVRATPIIGTPPLASLRIFCGCGWNGASDDRRTGLCWISPWSAS